MKKSLIKKSVSVLVLLAMIAASIYCIPGLIDDCNNHHIATIKFLENISTQAYENDIQLHTNYATTIIITIIVLSLFILISIYTIYRIIRGAKNEILYAKYTIEDFKAEREQEIKTKEEERKNKQLKTLEEQKALIEKEIDRMKK